MGHLTKNFADRVKVKDGLFSGLLCFPGLTKDRLLPAAQLWEHLFATVQLKCFNLQLPLWLIPHKILAIIFTIIFAHSFLLFPCFPTIRL